MTVEKLPRQLRVCCECDKWIGVLENDAGLSVTCVCGRRVEVPLLEEFQNNSDLLSATTVENRILRLVRAGDLPITGACACCGDVNDTAVVRAILDCERSSVRHRSGISVLWIPGLFTVWTVREEKPEVFGNDTTVPAPICMCAACQRQVQRFRPSYFLEPIGFALILGGVAAVLHWFVGVVIMIVTLIVGWFFAPGRVYWARQRELKDVLGRVPVYRQMLAGYPYAIVIVPREFGRSAR